MELREFFSEDAVKLELAGTTKDEILKEMISLLSLVAFIASARAQPAPDAPPPALVDLDQERDGVGARLEFGR